MHRSPSAAMSVLLVVGLSVTAALAIERDRSAGVFDHLVKPRTGGTIGIQARPLGSLPDGDPLRREWETAAAEHWKVWLDERSGLPTLALGRGERWLDKGGVRTSANLDGLATRARGFLRDRVSVLGDWGDQPVLDREASGPRGGDKWLVRFRQVVDGVPVEGAHYDFNLSDGKLVAFGARRWAPVQIPVEPELDPAQARKLLDSYVRPGLHDGIVDLAAPELLLLPLDADPSSKGAWKGARGAGLSHRLIWRFRFTDFAGIASWTGEIDAHSGGVVAFYDDTRYERIKGHVNPSSDTLWCDEDGCPEPDYPMPYVDYTEDGGPVQFANAFGLYDCGTPGSTIETTLDGQYFRISDQCGALSETATCDAELDLGVADDVNCGVAAGASTGNTDAARSSYYSLNLVRRKARFWDPGNAWLDSQVECRTNVNATCNATWGNNTINMYNAGNGCGNTGQIQGVVTHEWGHGYDENDGGGFDNPSEAYADVVAIFESRDSCVGPGFRVAQTCSGFGDACLTCTGVRDMDWDARQAHTPATPSGFVATYCPGGGGPCGEETHCASYVPSEAIFDLTTRDLPAMGLDPETAWQLAERLWYQSRPGSGGDVFHCSLPDSDSCSVGSWYHQLRVQDDDDGDLSNGTPHAAAIFAAFDRHDIACGFAGDPENQNTTSCPTLAAPQIAFSTQTNAVDLQWGAVAGAGAFRVYRNENGCDRGQYPLVEVDGATTSYLDGGLANGFPLFYRVQAIGTNPACESPVSACLEAAAQATAGMIDFDRESYGCNHEIVLEVRDANHSAASVAVTVRSDTESTPEVVVLTETSAGSARFSGTIPATTATAAQDGLLSIADGDAIHAEYVDADDGAGGTNLVRQAEAIADCGFPTITLVGEAGVSDVQATITWSTNEPATSTVFFGETVPPTGESALPSLTTDHAVTLGGLTECTVYRYAIRSVDAAGNVSYDDRDGAYFNFETWGDFGAGLQPCHQGRVNIDTDAVACTATVPLTLADLDLNTNPAAAETVAVPITSTTEPNGESVLLTETGPDTSIFSGSIFADAAPPAAGDGTLQIVDGDLLTATYADHDDGTGNAGLSFDTALVDCLGPEHTSIAVGPINANDATIDWTTSEPTTGHVEWGTTPALGNQVASDDLATTHSATVGTFVECGRVYFRVTSTDAQGNPATADVAGAPFEFDSGTIGGTLLRDGFETDSGWTLQGEWEIDVPQGLGSAPGDPPAAATESSVLGHDLSGQGAHPGDFEPRTTESAVSPVIDVSSASGAELRFYRWLNMETGGFSYVEVRDAGGTWNTVWVTPTSGGHTESEWTLQTYDVSEYLAGNANFQVRFRNQSVIDSAFDAGWNVDDFVVRDTGFPLYASCGGCGGAPTFGGAVSATDDDPCADSGITLSWLDAPAWGSGSGGTYVVYRDTQPGFLPSISNRIASGIAGTTWTDPAPPAGVASYYVVRAENDESCGSGPNNGGVVDSNLIYASAVNETGQPDPGQVDESLVVEAINRVHVRLSWTPEPTAAAYQVKRAASPEGGFSLVAEPTASQYEDAGAMGDSQNWYYLVEAVDACGSGGAGP